MRAEKVEDRENREEREEGGGREISTEDATGQHEKDNMQTDLAS